MVIITVKTNTHEHYLAFFFSIISEFRISLPLRSKHVLLSKHTNPEDILCKKWKENYSKHIEVQLGNDNISKSQRHMPDSQEAKCPVGHILGGRWKVLITLGCNRDGKEKAFQ